MRWLVEVAPVGAADSEAHCVEAESWQRALQAVRHHRGDASPMSGFSIELLEEGYRAVDPVARVRFVVRSAPPEAAITVVASNSMPPPSLSSVPSASKSVPPRPATGKSVPPPAAPTLVASSEIVTSSGSFSPLTAEGAAPVPQEPATERDLGGLLPGYPALIIAYRRAREASQDAPLTYREFAYALPRPIPEDEAEKILRGLLERVQGELDDARAGKFVNLALFDVVFEGKPPVMPVATLAWKDWAKEPVVSFPRRRASMGGIVVPAPSGSMQAAPTTGAASGAIPAAPAAGADAPTPLMPPAAVPHAAPLMAPGPTPLMPPVATSPSQVPPPPLSGSTTQPLAALSAQADPFAAPKPAPAPTPGGVIPIASRRISQMGLQAQRPNAHSTGRLQAAAAQRGRIQGDELIAALFEAMHDMHFLSNTLEAGEFCLAVANEMIPARAGVVYVYDIMKREYVVTCTSGAGTDGLVSRRFPDADEMLQAAMKHKTALVIPNARQHAAAMRMDRYTLVGGASSVVVAPVLAGMRVLGAIELVNPVDGAPFTETDGNALGYIADQFCEFIGSHGLVMDVAQILARKSELPPR